MLLKHTNSLCPCSLHSCKTTVGSGAREGASGSMQMKQGWEGKQVTQCRQAGSTRQRARAGGRDGGERADWSTQTGVPSSLSADSGWFAGVAITGIA